MEEEKDEVGEDEEHLLFPEGALTKTHKKVNLGAPYGTEYWQLHDNKRQTGVFKSELALSKSRLHKKKRLLGLDPEILPCEIVFVVQDAIMKSFINSQYSTAALLQRGWNPYNRNLFYNIQILVMAPEAVQHECNIVRYDPECLSAF